MIVDYQVCFIGGLDLCFGRYDTFEHKVGDYPALVWPGKDYYNPRLVNFILEIFHWRNYSLTELWLGCYDKFCISPRF